MSASWLIITHLLTHSQSWFSFTLLRFLIPYSTSSQLVTLLINLRIQMPLPHLIWRHKDSRIIIIPSFFSISISHTISLYSNIRTDKNYHHTVIIISYLTAWDSKSTVMIHSTGRAWSSIWVSPCPTHISVIMGFTVSSRRHALCLMYRPDFILHPIVPFNSRCPTHLFYRLDISVNTSAINYQKSSELFGFTVI
jgi:hypothetical protein